MFLTASLRLGDSHWFLHPLALGLSDALAKELVWFDKKIEEFLEKLPEAELNLGFKPLPSGLLTEALAPKKESAELSEKL